MTPIQQMFLGVGGATKTYVDDIFSPYVYAGNSSTQSISNGVDLSGKGGMVWTKTRNQAYGHFLFDTENGNGNYIRSDTGDAKATYSTSGTHAGITEFNSTGFSLGADQSYQVLNYSGNDYTSWTFRKAPGFFDVVTWSGNSTAGRQISHNLGCVPGAIFTKRLNLSENWLCYHRGMGNEKYIHLNLTNEMGDATYFNDTDPTSTYFTVNDAAQINGTGYSYVAYVFAGGASTAATARSVDFDGNGDYLGLASNADLCPGTSDFTFEAWIYPTAAWSTSIFQGIYVNGYDPGVSGALWIGNNPNSSSFVVRGGGVTDYIQASYPPVGQWTHVAVTRSGSTLRLFYNGTLEKSVSNSIDFPTALTNIGSDGSGSNFTGKISNVRFVKGTAVYTSSFKSPTEPLTNITNTTLLCCQGSSTTSVTVGPTLTENGNPTASTDSPFYDTSSYVFGENEDQNLIACGSYTGNGSAAGPTVDLGWEPQFLLIKRITTNGGQWGIFDDIRGVVTESDDAALYADNTSAETSYDYLSLTSTGFQLKSSSGDVNDNTKDYIYIAIRRPDGYVGKPPSLGTDVFAMDASPVNAFPSFVSGFPVDFALDKKPAASGSWEATSRFMASNKYLITELTNGDSTYGSTPGEWRKDSMTGFGKSTWNGAGYQGWMWKRGQGFDVVTYTGNGIAGHSISHSLSKTPEMIWCKERSSTGAWWVGHKGLDGGNEPWTHYMILNTTAAEDDYEIWNDTAPTSTHFTIGSHGEINGSSDTYIAILFASVTGISKCGYYDGSDSEQTITTGFQPRFIIIKCITNAFDWLVFDTVRGWASGNDKELNLNKSDAQDSSYDVGAPTSTGFTLTNPGDGSEWDWNDAGKKYIYYAHA